MEPSTNTARPTREPFRIVLSPGLWRGVEATVQPATSAHPLRSFRTHREAMAYAEQLARVESWPIVDQTEGAA